MLILFETNLDVIADLALSTRAKDDPKLIEKNCLS